MLRNCMSSTPASGFIAIRLAGTALIVAMAFFHGHVARAQDAPATAPRTPVAADEDTEDAAYEELASEFTLLQQMGELVKKVARVTRPSVVHIEASKTERTGTRSEQFEEAGSGILARIENRTYVLSNRHVVLNAPPESIDVRFSDGRVANPVRVVADRNTDVALLELAIDDVRTARLGDSDQVEIGDFVLAVGSPFGLSHSVTFGIISATGRRDLTLGEQSIELQDFFQTDAAINPGNSGGPLINLRGEVIGLNTAIASSSGGSEGIGFAIPINIVMQVAEQLAQNGEVKRGRLGVVLDNRFDAQAASRVGLDRPMGARVKQVMPGSAAEKANLMPGDIILQYDGIPIEDDNHLVIRAGLTPIGKQVSMVVMRGGKRYQVKVVVSPM